MNRLSKVTVGGVTRAVDLLSARGQLLAGNSRSYAANPYSALTAMWGYTRAADLRATSSVRVFPTTFPNATIFSWNVIPSPSWAGVNGYLYVAYGNYSQNPGTITPRQLNAITDLAVAIDWTYAGDPASGLLSECWLTAAATPSGPLTTTHEVAFFPKVSADAITYVSGLPNVGTGSFTDSNGIVWNVKQGVSGTGGPYFIAYRPGYADFTGTLRYDDYFRFLTASGKTTGSEWFNGVAFGVEPKSGAGSLSVNKFAVTYD